MKAKRKPTTKHVNVELRWSSKFEAWCLYAATATGRILVRCPSTASKKCAIFIAADYCRREEARGQPCELSIKNLDGRIGKGRSAKRSYGCESRARG